ncbi:MAG: ABC transporter permease [Actinobacteria bacterium]|nr:ABC transporter permease [Actinomycetota bacterium]
MNRRRIGAIYRKDMRDALRDSRVLTALLMPLLLGVFYSFAFGDDAAVQKIKVGVVAAEATKLTEAIQAQAPDSVRLTFVDVQDQGEVERQVQREDLDVGLVVPAGFDADVRAGKAPSVLVLVPSAPSGSGGDFVAAVVDRSVEAMAGRAPAARVVQRTMKPAEDSSEVALTRLGAQSVFVLVSAIMLLGMLAVYAVPAVLIEEAERKTIDALTLIASPAEVIAAKGQFGVTLSLVSVPVLLVITRSHPEDVVGVISAVLLSAVVLVGIGLAFAGLLRTQQQVNTWSGIVLLALLAPAFTVGLAAPAIVNQILAFLPTVWTFRLLADAFAGEQLYPDRWLAYVVLVAWGVAAYGLVWWRLSRQEA